MTTAYHNKALPEGAILREWRLERVLGVGGFGIVYQGRGRYFDETVAIKEYFPSAISDRRDDTTVTPTDSSSEEVYALGLQKFVEEAKVLWNLSKPERHPNIVAVKSLFEINGTAYMVMDFESGASLSQMLKAGERFDEARLLGILTPIAEGLDRAHRANVLHRDIKPANILVDNSGRPVLIDFGSARFESNQATSTKVTFYTPPYAALEQYVKTYPQGPWTDIYALGVTLYECVAGEKPLEVLERLHGGVDTPLSAREWPGFSPAFTRAVDAAMAIKPADRPQSIPQWLAMFRPDAQIDDEPTRVARYQPAPPEPVASPAPDIAPAVVAEPPSAPRPDRKLLVAGGIGAVLVVGAALAVVSSRHGPPAAPTAPAAGLTVVTTAAAGPGAPSASLASDLETLLTDARALGRPAGEIAALTAGKTRIAGLQADLAQAPQGPDAAAKLADLNKAASSLARTEASALKRDAAAQLSDLQGNPAWTGQPSGAVATLHSAKAGLDSAVAGVTSAPDADAAVLAADRTLAADKAFQAAFASAKPAFLAAQKANYAAVEAAARQSGADIAKLAGGSKPWLFSSRTAKAAYQSAQDAAGKARASLAQLDTLSAGVQGATELKPVNAAVTQAGAIAQTLKDSDTAVAAALKAAGR